MQTKLKNKKETFIEVFIKSYLYQKIAQKATELRLLGMSYLEIAKSLNISKNTAVKACKFKNGCLSKKIPPQ